MCAKLVNTYMGVVISIGVYHWKEIEIPSVKIPKTYMLNSVFICFIILIILIIKYLYKRKPLNVMRQYFAKGPLQCGEGLD